MGAKASTPAPNRRADGSIDPSYVKPEPSPPPPPTKLLGCIAQTGNRPGGTVIGNYKTIKEDPRKKYDPVVIGGSESHATNLLGLFAITLFAFLSGVAVAVHVMSNQ